MPVFFEYNNDVSAIQNMAENATSATTLAHCTPIVMLQNMVDLIRGQTVFLDMRDVAAWRGVPDNLRPSHDNDILKGTAFCCSIQAQLINSVHAYILRDQGAARASSPI
ncbi:MAG: hypothetical protein NTW36_02035 [Planctomycetia bacterium]|nr:hypothetical protein [Planctomycetia bacterium]